MRNERGSILIFSYLVVAALVALGSALTVRTLAEQNSSSRSVRLASAFQTAEAGLDQALIELRTNEDWTGASGLSVPNGGYYDVAVTEETANPTLKTLTITGHYPSTDPTAQGYQRRRVEAVVQMSSPSVFQYGLFGDEDVQIKKKVTTDSYDSDLGDYEDQDPGDNGDVATNSTDEDCVSLAKDTTINGQVKVGPEMEDPEDAVHLDDAVTITGTPQIVSLAGEMELPAVTAPGTCGGDLKVDKTDTLSLTE
ncbi:MAG: pilus assembly PilX N-terminal domain-containing protein, partial [Candidatus Omnitrophica bacterium]|nr:pilus assembly PilX N-terminal domain-containing protein [Candidatus Omnitrophota bacterium]